MTNNTKKTLLIVFEVFMIIVAFIFMIPVLLTLINSLKTDAQIYQNPASFPTSIQIINFVNAWKETKFPLVFFNTFLITSLSTVGIILVSSMASYAMVRTKSKLSWAFFLLFTFSMVVPFQTIMIPLVVTAKALNLKNIFGIIPIYFGLGCPMAIFMYHGFIKGIPLELEESAAIDGASIFRTFFTIVLPLLTPITATIAILDVLWIWNDFLLPLIILPKQTTIQLAQYGFFGQFKTEFGKAMASLVLSASPIVIFYLAMQKYIIKGIMAGAIKG
ncbi:MAG: sugar ABC transporter permease [Spirochaetes bacterium GWC1_27_15]|nr:MAG: sugar ABC transporter permease [Spirochaetes bacterium GWB1_27_13]OHD20188.1 MAG: sugar ABC transporter permease [Spirochaetes bacterium GWC1_27_15]